MRCTMHQQAANFAFMIALLPLQLVGRRYDSARVIALIASEGCSVLPEALPGLAARLGSTARLDLVSLVPSGELGSGAVEAALQLVQLHAAYGPAEAQQDGLNERLVPTGSSAGSSDIASAGHVGWRGSGSWSGSWQQLCSWEAEFAQQEAADAVVEWQMLLELQREDRGPPPARARLIWLEPPEHGLEPWQTLEPLLERLEAPGLALSPRQRQDRRAAVAAGDGQACGRPQRQAGPVTAEGMGLTLQRTSNMQGPSSDGDSSVIPVLGCRSSNSTTAIPVLQAGHSEGAVVIPVTQQQERSSRSSCIDLGIPVQQQGARRQQRVRPCACGR